MRLGPILLSVFCGAFCLGACFGAETNNETPAILNAEMMDRGLSLTIKNGLRELALDPNINVEIKQEEGVLAPTAQKVVEDDTFRVYVKLFLGPASKYALDGSGALSANVRIPPEATKTVEMTFQEGLVPLLSQANRIVVTVKSARTVLGAATLQRNPKTGKWDLLDGGPSGQSN